VALPGCDGSAASITLGKVLGQNMQMGGHVVSCLACKAMTNHLHKCISQLVCKTECWPCMFYLQVHESLYEHEVAPLVANAASMLLRQAAGLEGTPDDRFLALEDDILRTCGNLPLALQVTGACLKARAGEDGGWQVRPSQRIMGVACTSVYSLPSTVRNAVPHACK
jgi:hypothetical protein